MAQVGVAVHGRAADVHTHMAGMDGNEEFLPARHRIGQIEISHKKKQSENPDC
jgi:hypothetical protein